MDLTKIDWINLAQNRSQLRALINMVMIFEFHNMLEILEWLNDWRLLKKNAAPYYYYYYYYYY
jgi:hypothetical protein